MRKRLSTMLEIPLLRRCPAFWPHCSSYKRWALDQHWEYLVTFKIWFCHCHSFAGQEKTWNKGARVYREVKTNSRLGAAGCQGGGGLGNSGGGKGWSNISLWEFLLWVLGVSLKILPVPRGGETCISWHSWQVKEDSWRWWSASQGSIREADH